MHRAHQREEAKGATLIELMVAVVLLAIAVLFMTMVPNQSQRQMWKGDRVSAATAAARDRIEFIRTVVGRTSPIYSGYDVVKANFPNGNTVPDTFRGAEVRVVRRTTCFWTNPDSGKVRIRVRCIALDGGQVAIDSMDTQVIVETWIAKRDTLPPFE